MKSLALSFVSRALRDSSELPPPELADHYELAAEILHKAQADAESEAADKAAKAIRESEAAQRHFKALIPQGS